MTLKDWQLDWDEALDNMQSRDPQKVMQSWQNSSDKFKAKWALSGDLNLDLVYGEHSRERYDIFRPSGDCRGTVILHSWRLLDENGQRILVIRSRRHSRE